jgi:hypothetical protein
MSLPDERKAFLDRKPHAFFQAEGSSNCVHQFSPRKRLQKICYSSDLSSPLKAQGVVMSGNEDYWQFRASLNEALIEFKA